MLWKCTVCTQSVSVCWWQNTFGDAAHPSLGCASQAAPITPRLWPHMHQTHREQSWVLSTTNMHSSQRPTKNNSSCPEFYLLQINSNNNKKNNVSLWKIFTLKNFSEVATPERSRDIGTMKIAVIFYQCSLYPQQYKQHKEENYFTRYRRDKEPIRHQRKHLDVEVIEDKNVRGEGLRICLGSSRGKRTKLGISWTRVRVDKEGQNPGLAGQKPGKSNRRSE